MPSLPNAAASSRGAEDRRGTDAALLGARGQGNRGQASHVHAQWIFSSPSQPLAHLNGQLFLNSPPCSARPTRMKTADATRVHDEMGQVIAPVPVPSKEKHGMHTWEGVAGRLPEQHGCGRKGSHHVASLADCLVSFTLPSSSSPVGKNMMGTSAVEAARMHEGQGRGGRKSAGLADESVEGMPMGEWAISEEELLQCLKAKWHNHCYE